MADAIYCEQMICGYACGPEKSKVFVYYEM